MIKPISRNHKGLITITGPTRSGKSQLAEFLIKNHESVTYIATAKARKNDPNWDLRIKDHKNRRPDFWKLVEHPKDICKVINSVDKDESILIDSLGGLVDHHLIENQSQWEKFQNEFVNCLVENNLCVVIVAEEVGWGIVPSTEVGHLFRERLSKLTSLICRCSTNSWLAVNGTAIDLGEIGHPIP